MVNGDDARQFALIEFGSDCEEVKAAISEHQSKFRKQVRYFLRDHGNNASRCKQSLIFENLKHQYTIRVETSNDFLYSAPDFTKKCSWQEIPFIVLKIDRADHQEEP